MRSIIHGYDATESEPCRNEQFAELGVSTLHAKKIELLQGTLDMLVLRTLRWGPQHGYGISQTIRSQSDEVLQVETGSLYPALHRLERQGWVTSEWKQTQTNQRAKYYRLTAAGRKQLAAEQARWEQLVAAIASVMQERQAEG